VPAQQIQLNNPGGNTVTLSSLTLTETGASPAGITSVSLVKNGTVIATTGFTGTTATFNFTDTIGGSNGAVTYQVVANYSNSAPTGSYQFSVTGGAGSNGQPVLFNGLPVNGATVTIVLATMTPSRTPTNSPTSTDTSSFTPTPTATPSKTPTQTATSTDTPTFPATQTATPTMTPILAATMTPTLPPIPSSTPTPAENQGVVLYPNPVAGPTVNVLPPAYSGVSDVQVEIFTTAFRKVQDETFANVPPGVAVTVELKDKWGAALADGLYYVVVIVDGHRSIAKLLVLR
jgi:hypothetical protein